MLDLPADQGGVSEAERVSVWEAMKTLASDEREIVMLATVQGLHHTRGFRNAWDSAWNGQQQTASDPEKTS